ncbi:uncharacterized protein ColSpa_12076 [Colletotrichum spaethianum]|uniref:Gag1-like clamp domain-containing protein n=1 Tax=Colletotrichum spaethianum TaxID=700344 RepID=A0AA37PH18_9PEZI|nr:uncharacterized protein ColSpa_12076 [Colletotrichum spaethianum]GKT51895.1 hypothetical protein ColSpa_12076 [Colletotrichum spaethianum]
MPESAPLEATIRPLAAAATTPDPVLDPDTGVPQLQLHHTHPLPHPHNQPTPHATATATPAAAAATPALANTPPATLPEASLAHRIKTPAEPSLDSSPMPPPAASPSSAAPLVNPPPKTNPHPSSSSSASTSKMLFSEIYKSPRSPLSKFRLSMSQQPLTLDLPDYDPDLLSKDKVKQKEAVKKYLAAKVRNDWEFVWPPVASLPQNGDVPPAADAPPEGESVEQVQQETPEPQADATATATSQDEAVETMESDEDDEDEEEDSDAESVYSTVSEDPARFKPRLEWVSDLSDEDPPMSLSPFRFDSPDAIGAAVKASVADKRARRRRAVREEMAWNEGLACFEARRNAWTGARTVRVRTKPASPMQTFSPLSPRRLFFRSSFSHPSGPASPSSPGHSLQKRPSNEASAAVSDGSELSKDPSKELTAQKSKESQKSAASPASTTYPIETIVPLSAPLLPPGNPMRASITPAVYMSLYEKVIVHALTPSCPVNLSDMIRACVVGWKRDGEWPPRPSAAEPGIVAVRRRKKSATEGQNQNAARRMSFGFLGRGEKADTHDESAGKGIRKSLQRVLGIGQHPASAAPSSGNNGAAANGKDTAAV